MYQWDTNPHNQREDEKREDEGREEKGEGGGERMTIGGLSLYTSAIGFIIEKGF